ncbi:MAG: type II toxin-antitoxin system VapB family antitoxin [Tepidiformaceae bacterium]
MRTTVEIDDELRAKLMALAAARGEKGFSRIVNEAVRNYVEDLESDDRQQRLREIHALWGSIAGEDAEHMRAVVKDLRESWR